MELVNNQDNNMIDIDKTTIKSNNIKEDDNDSSNSTSNISSTFPSSLDVNNNIIQRRNSNDNNDLSVALNHFLFLPPAEGTPAAQALQANAELQINKMTKIFHKFRGLKRPKMKNLNIVKQLKKHTKYRGTKKKNFKGKVIDGLHELYSLTAGMMLGIRCTIGRSNYTDKEGLTLDDFNHVDKMI